MVGGPRAGEVQWGEGGGKMHGDDQGWQVVEGQRSDGVLGCEVVEGLLGVAGARCEAVEGGKVIEGERQGRRGMRG